MVTKIISKPKVLKISQIKFDKESYPRINVDWVTCARYYNALKSGAVFPAITVARYKADYILVDGAHRLKAHKDCKETHINTEVLIGLTKEQIFEEAVKRNSVHGRQFSTQEVAKICITLEAWGKSQEAISELVHIPVESLRKFVAERSTRINETQEEVALKSPLKHLEGISLEELKSQGPLVNRTQIGILDSLIVLLENHWLNTSSILIMAKLERVKKLLKTL